MVSLFRNVLGKIRGAIGGSSGAKSVLGIDIGSSSVKVVQLRLSRGTAVLETYGEIALGPYADQSVGKTVKLSAEQIAEALKDLVREANVTAKNSGVSIPFASSLLSIIDMPKVDDEQLKRMMPIEARKYIPMSANDVMLDWFVIPEEENDETFDRVEEKKEKRKNGQEVLLVAIHKESLRIYQSVMQMTSRAVEFFEIEIFSTIRSALGHGIAPIAVVDIGAATTKVYVVERGIVRTSHLINTGSQSMTETLSRAMEWNFEKAERMKREWGMNDAPTYSREENEKMHEALLSTLGRVFSETNRVLLSYGKRYNKNVASVVLSGGGASLPGLAAHANPALNAEVTMADPFAKVETPAFLESVLHEIGPGFAVAVGVALRELRQSG